MTVIDASAVTDFLVGGDQSQVAPLFAAGHTTLAPELIYLEVGEALHKLLRRGAITDELAQNSLHNLTELRLDTYSHSVLVGIAWEFRHNLTVYDAAYVALAQLMGTELATGDSGLASVAARALGADRVRHFT